MPYAYRKSGFGPPTLQNLAPAQLLLNAPFQLPVRTLQKNRRPAWGLLLFCLDWSFLIPNPYRGDNPKTSRGEKLYLKALVSGFCAVSYTESVRERMYLSISSYTLSTLTI